MFLLGSKTFQVSIWITRGDCGVWQSISTCCVIAPPSANEASTCDRLSPSHLQLAQTCHNYVSKLPIM